MMLRRLLSGADKVGLNTILFEDKYLITRIAENYGQQSLIASIEAKLIAILGVLHP